MKRKIYVVHNSIWNHGGESLSDKPFSDTADTYYDFELNGVFLHDVQTSSYVDEMEIEEPIPDHIFIVVERYTDGDTFGTSFGHGSIEGACHTIEEAQEIKAAIERDEKVHDGTFKSWHGSNVWQGYFNDLESVEIISTPILP